MSDPVAALADAYCDGQPMGVDFDDAAAAVKRLAEQGKFIIDVEGLRRALAKEAHVCQDWGEHAAAILAAIQEQTDE